MFKIRSHKCSLGIQDCCYIFSSCQIPNSGGSLWEDILCGVVFVIQIIGSCQKRFWGQICNPLPLLTRVKICCLTPKCVHEIEAPKVCGRSYWEGDFSHTYTIHGRYWEIKRIYFGELYKRIGKHVPMSGFLGSFRDAHGTVSFTAFEFQQYFCLSVTQFHDLLA